MMRIRKLTKQDEQLYYELAGEFYHSPAVLHPVPEKNLKLGFEELMRENSLLQAQIIECGDRAAGFALLARSYSQEAGGEVIWLEELYILPEYRGRGLGEAYMRDLIENKPAQVKRIRLEIERNNEGAKRLYEKMNFGVYDYEQMIRDF